MNFLKNIILVSYLKNKGIRRICFVLGLIPFTFYFVFGFVGNIKYNFYYEEYKSFNDFVNINKYSTIRKKLVFEKYPAKIGIKNLHNFDDWNSFFFDTEGSGSLARNFYINSCLSFLVGGEENVKENILKVYSQDELPEAISKLKETCPKLQNYRTMPIKIYRLNILYLLWLIPCLLLIYIPFLICCTIKWIYAGFKEK